MKGSFKLGNIFGIGVFIHWTFSLLIAYIIFRSYREGNNVEQILWLVLFVLSIFLTVFLHELGHALGLNHTDDSPEDIMQNANSIGDLMTINESLACSKLGSSDAFPIGWQEGRDLISAGVGRYVSDGNE